MKKKLSLFIVLSLVLVLAFAFSVSAATNVTDDGSNVTLGDCTIENLDGVTIPSPTRGLVYTLEDTGTATVSGKGSFAGGDLVFPSSVTYNGKTYSLTKINSQLFQNLTYNLYVPDSVTFIGGGSYSGTFGNSTIAKIYIGKGLVGFEREVFSGSSGVETFVCKAKPTYIGVYAFNVFTASSNGMTKVELDFSEVTRVEELAFNSNNLQGRHFISYANVNFSEKINYIGPNAFVGSKANGSIVIPADCELSYRCFNGTSFEMVVIKVEKGTTRQLPQELFSGSDSGLTVVFDGAAEANQNHVFSGNDTKVYMPSYDMIEKLALTASKKSGNERLGKVTFYSCKENMSYSSTSAGALTEIGVGEHIYSSKLSHLEANCSQYERDAYVCYACGYENVVYQGTELSNHVFDVTVKIPTCQSMGYTAYKCTVCNHEEAAHFIPTIEHSAKVITYSKNNNHTVTVTKSCEFCKQVVKTEELSLVNKCYIDGYGLFDATMDYVFVDANGVVTPSTANFDNAVIYFPSYVNIDGNIVEVKTIQGFKAKSIKGIYIPDTVTRIAGGSGVGCFGDISTLKNVVVGKGVTTIEQETFCMGSGATLDEFIFKGTITRIEMYGLKTMKRASKDIPYEFNTNLIYVGKQVNLDGNLLSEVKIAKGCDLHEGFAFNNANGLLTVYIEGGDSASEALNLGQEFTSNTGTKYWYIKGYVTVSAQAVLSGQNDSIIYMESTDAIDVFANAIKANGYNDRIEKAVFMDCSTGTAWYVNRNAERTVHGSKTFGHGVVNNEVDSTCTQAGTHLEICFVCGKTVSSNTIEVKDHAFDGGVITVMPTKEAEGEIVYSCLTCGETETRVISKLSQNHNCVIVIKYENGFDNKGTESVVCPDCEYKESKELPVIFVALGYSVSDDMTGITCRYRINREALAHYEEIMGSVELGFIVADASDVAINGVVDEEYKLLSNVRGCQIVMTNKEYSFIEVKIVGATTEESQAHNFIFSAYIVTNENEQKKISYVQSQEKSSLDVVVGDYTLKAININKASE